MSIRLFNSYTHGTRTKTLSNFSDITINKPNKQLINKNYRNKGRNHRGIITIRHRGGGHKKKYRQIDFRRNKHNVSAIVKSIEYDPYRNARISLLHYVDGEKRYILHPSKLSIGSRISSGSNFSMKIGSSFPLKDIPLGTFVHNIELTPNKGGQIVRSAGTTAKILSKEGNYVSLRLPSKEIRLVKNNCFATIGILSNKEFSLIKSGKAGRSRWLSKRPAVRGSAMNACDHPHGGGEGKSPIGHNKPLTPWGKPTIGYKTRKIRNISNKYILSDK